MHGAFVMKNGGKISCCSEVSGIGVSGIHGPAQTSLDGAPSGLHMLVEGWASRRSRKIKIYDFFVIIELRENSR